jgi:DICT domain-containing protein
MSIRGFVEAVEPSDLTVSVRAPEPDAGALGPLQNLLERIFDAPGVRIDRASAPAPEREALVYVLDREADEETVALATSRLRDVSKSMLLVNEDLYTTGARDLDEVDTPAAVLALDDTTFPVRGKQKFLLIHLSRHVEAMAAETGGGSIHTCFQQLSRVTDERGTQRVYERLSAGPVDVHVYGVDDRADPVPLPVGVHADDGRGELGNSWFVVHDGAGRDARKAALVAVQTGPGAYDGFWTFDPDRVDDVLAYLADTYDDLRGPTSVTG